MRMRLVLQNTGEQRPTGSGSDARYPSIRYKAHAPRSWPGYPRDRKTQANATCHRREISTVNAAEDTTRRDIPGHVGTHPKGILVGIFVACRVKNCQHLNRPRHADEKRGYRADADGSQLDTACRLDSDRQFRGWKSESLADKRSARHVALWMESTHRPSSSSKKIGHQSDDYDSRSLGNAFLTWRSVILGGHRGLRLTKREKIKNPW
ncbi:hypothetical protein KM043_006592 [Ampulex compressa]|nr:hypothetical protein KM043_006592 [Ampulex compressa]